MNAQVTQDNKLKPNPFKTWVLSIDKTQQKTGPVYLFELKDSSISVCRDLMYSYAVRPWECRELNIPVFYIEEIRIRDQNKTLVHTITGLLQGAALGSGIGYMIGYSGGDDQPGLFSLSAREKGKIGGLVGACSGAVSGAIIGANVKIKIPINGDVGMYQKKLNKIREYSMKK